MTGRRHAPFANHPPCPVPHSPPRLREGGRSPLISPAACGTYTTVTTLTPSGDPTNPISLSSNFKITPRVGGGPCPPAGTPPFAPGFQAGPLNNHAATFSPLYLRLSRRAGDQDLT